MADERVTDSVWVEWFNVTYRMVGMVVGMILLLGLGSGSYWFYFHRYLPHKKAQEAIGRADGRLREASGLRPTEELDEILDTARVSLDEAHSGFDERRYEDAFVAAIRSENLSLKAISMAGGDESESRTVRFYRIEGDVRVKQAGAFSWNSADTDMQLRIGDQVKTSSSGSAQLIYFDGTMTSIRPGSLLEIRDLYEDPVTKVRRVKEKLTWGEVEASTQKRNVNGSYHEVTTAKVSARSEGGGEFRVSFDKNKKTSVVDVFDGKIAVSTAGKKETLKAGERIKAKADGSLSAKQSLPGLPRLLTPSDQRVFIFEDPLEEKLTLSWEKLAGISRYRLVISNSSLFTDPLYDAERNEAQAIVDGVTPGSYYWKVAAINRQGVTGPFSQARRFRISSQRIRDRTDTDPPKLEISEFVPIGQMVVINGETEPGATLWVDNAKIDVYEDGTFNAVVKLRKEGLNELVLVAQDTAGNETTDNRSAYVETY